MPAPPPPPGAPITKVQEVQLQVEQVSNVMRDNVSQMLTNYEKAEVLEAKAADLTQESKKFYKRSNQVKNNMWWKNIKLMGLIACIVIILLLVIIVPLVVQAQAAKAAISAGTGGGSGNKNSASPSSGSDGANSSSTGY